MGTIGHPPSPTQPFALREEEAEAPSVWRQLGPQQAGHRMSQMSTIFPYWSVAQIPRMEPWSRRGCGQHVGCTSSLSRVKPELWGQSLSHTEAVVKCPLSTPETYGRHQ